MPALNTNYESIISITKTLALERSFSSKLNFTSGTCWTNLYRRPTYLQKYLFL